MKLLAIFIIGISISICAFSIPIESSEVVNVQGLKKEALYSNALSWFATDFKSANNVIQMKDIETGKVIGKAIIENRYVTIIISCKDEKYKFEISLGQMADAIIPITFSVDKWFFYKGQTTGELRFLNGAYDIENIIFTNSTAWVGHYGVKDINFSQEWTDAVNKEQLKILKSYDDLMANPENPKNITLLKMIADNLKSAMSKTADF